MAKPFLVDLLRRSRNLFGERGRLSWRPAREQRVSQHKADTLPAWDAMAVVLPLVLLDYVT